MILTLEEAIAREEDIVADNERFCAVAPSESAEAYHSATYHRQIAEWLKELAGRKTGKWIVSTDCEGKRRTNTCPFCGDKRETFGYTPKYCEECGARLEADDADSN